LDQWKRLAPAAIISAAGLALTFYLYHRSTLLDLAYNNISPIAYVKSVDGDHQTLRANSTLWNPAQEGDPIYAGDTLKTGDQGSLRVQMINPPSAFEAEARTQVRFEFGSTQKLIRLEEGYFQTLAPFDGTQNIFVAAADQKPWPAKALTVNRGENGNVEFSDPLHLDLTNGLGITFESPQGQFESELNPEEPVPQLFRWTGEAEDLRVAVQWGDTRKNLGNRLLQPSAKGEISATLPLGRHYWRWAVYREGTPEPVWTSQVTRAFVRGVFPPAAISPTGGVYVRLKHEGESVALKWLPSARHKQFTVQVFSDSREQNKVQEQQLDQKSVFEFKPPKFGTYYWRLSGFDEKRQAWLRSRQHMFRVGLKDMDKVEVRWLTRAGDILRYTTPAPTAGLAWKILGERKPKQYRVRVVAAHEDIKSAIPQFSPTEQIVAKVERSGRYKAVVEALNNEAEPIGESSPITFEVQSVPMLRAPAFADDSAAPLQATAKGTLFLNWRAINGAKEYLVELKDTQGKAQTFVARRPSHQLNKLMPGRYEVTVSAIDANDRAGEKSEARGILVPSKPAVKSPKIKKLEVR
jgi:hypothetical protein